MAKNDTATVYRRDQQSQENLARLISGGRENSTREYHDVSYGRPQRCTDYVAGRLQQQRRKYVAGNRTVRSAKRKDTTWALALGAVVMMVIIEIVQGLMR